MTTEPEPERELLFGEAEYRARLDRLRSTMRERGADVLLVDQVEHVAYLTGHGAGGNHYNVCVVPLDRDPIVILRRLDEPTFRERTWLGAASCLAFRDWDDPVEVLLTCLRDNGWASARLGVELDSNYLTARRYELLKAGLPRASFVDFSAVLWEQRLIKSPREIEYTRQAAAIADEAMQLAIAASGEGRFERDSALAVANFYWQRGVGGSSIGHITAGSRTGQLHGRMGNAPLQRGDILAIELLPTVNGYSARLMRPTAIGAPTREQQRAAEALLRVHDAQCAAMQPGAAAREVDRIAREGLCEAGLVDSYDFHTGYTLGYTRGPRISDFTRFFVPTADWRLEPGMVFHMMLNGGSLSFSETVLVTDHGPERLTRLARQMFVA